MMRTVRLALAGALALGATAAVTPTAGAATPATVSDAMLSWRLNPETQGSAFFGGCQYFSAGESDGTATTYHASDGAVSIKQGTAAATYDTRCGFVSAGTEQHVEFGGGTGTLDPTTGVSTIHWTGSWSVNFYGGLAPFWIKNPTLTVASGQGTVTATVGGYGSSQSDPSTKHPITPVDNVVIAKLSTVDGANTTGFTPPDYAGVPYDAPGGTTAQNRTAPGWGAWPTSFVNVQQATGLSSYWYSSGGAADARKPPLPLTVSYGTVSGGDAPSGHPTLTVSPSSGLKSGDPITVHGTGYDTTTPSQHGPGNAGAYVQLGWITPSGWRPSTGAAAGTRASTASVWVHNPSGGTAQEGALGADGSFTVTLPVDDAALQAKKISGGQLAVFTVSGGGASSAGAEASTPITLAGQPPTTTPPATTPTVTSCRITDTVKGGALTWGFKDSFRSYVASGPVANTITASGGATILNQNLAVAGNPASGTYRWPFASSGKYTSPSRFDISYGGSVRFHYPAHFFDLTIARPHLVVSGSAGTLRADVTLVQTGPGTPTTSTRENVALASLNLGAATTTSTAQGVARTGIAVRIQDTSAFTFNGSSFYQKGDRLDDAAVTLTGCAGTGPAPSHPESPSSVAPPGTDTDLVPTVTYRPEALANTGSGVSDLLRWAGLGLFVGVGLIGLGRRRQNGSVA